MAPKTWLQLQVEEERHRSIEDIIAMHRYGPSPLTYNELAAELDVSPGTLMVWSRTFGLTYKHIALETMRARLGIVIPAAATA